jgi:uncharacterized protein with HEPN domain
LSRDPLRLPDYLGYINEVITRIVTYCKDMDEASFLSNAMVQDAVIRNFEIIGEASRYIERVAPQFVENHPELPLAYAYEMRNVLAHGLHLTESHSKLTLSEPPFYPALDKQTS